MPLILAGVMLSSVVVPLAARSLEWISPSRPRAAQTQSSPSEDAAVFIGTPPCPVYLYECTTQLSFSGHNRTRGARPDSVPYPSPYVRPPRQTGSVACTMPSLTRCVGSQLWSYSLTSSWETVRAAILRAAAVQEGSGETGRVASPFVYDVVVAWATTTPQTETRGPTRDAGSYTEAAPVETHSTRPRRNAVCSEDTDDTLTGAGAGYDTYHSHAELTAGDRRVLRHAAREEMLAREQASSDFISSFCEHDERDMSPVDYAGNDDRVSRTARSSTFSVNDRTPRASVYDDCFALERSEPATPSMSPRAPAFEFKQCDLSVAGKLHAATDSVPMVEQYLQLRGNQPSPHAPNLQQFHSSGRAAVRLTA